MRIKQKDCMAIEIDMQEKLMPHIYKSEEVITRSKKLVKGLIQLKVPIIVSEQYKKGLGDTVPGLEMLLADNPHYEKKAFSCCDDTAIYSDLKLYEKKNIILFGTEAHICILQTALDLKKRGLNPIVVADCISSRTKTDRNIATYRFLQEGITLTTCESLLFELCRTSENEAFREISKIVK